MELVYLWVEEYKNIKNQGFNFSPRFDCKYDKNSNTLTIDEKKDYINIFPDNINITAIVGKNGSGKSNLINHFLDTIIYNTKTDYKTRGMICFLNDAKNKIYLNFNPKIISSFRHEFIYNDKTSLQEKLKQVFKDEYYQSFFYCYNNTLEIDNHLHRTYEYNKELLLTSEINKYDNKIDLEKENNKMNTYLMSLLLDQKRIPETVKNLFIPTRLYLDRNIFIKYFNSTSEEEDEYNELVNNTNTSSFDILQLETLIYLRFFIKDFNLNHSNFKEEINIHFENKNIISNYKTIYTELKGELEDYLRSIAFIKKDVRKDDNKSNDSTLIGLNELEKILNLLKNLTFYIPLIKKTNIAPEYDYEININLLDESLILKLKELPSYLKIEFASKEGIGFKSLSSGEKNILKLLFSIENIIHLRKDMTTSLYIILDEIENTFHPDWQKKILNWLINFTKEYKIQINLIIASHSPFILSDIPKENVIFLEDGEQKYPFKKTQTFGANIHTLLSDGFFMRDGLMGEFAKSKINDIIQTLKKETLSEDEIKTCKHIISIIGEPILQRTLEHQLNKKLHPNETELQSLEREQEELQEKINILKKNDNNEEN